MGSTIAQTVAISVIVGAVIAGLFTLFQIPLNKRRSVSKQIHLDQEQKLYADALLFFNDSGRLSPLEREKLRKQLVSDVKDRIRLYDSRRELANLEGRKTIG